VTLPPLTLHRDVKPPPSASRVAKRKPSSAARLLAESKRECERIEHEAEVLLLARKVFEHCLVAANEFLNRRV
jgi:hypothetical protein